MVKSTLFIAVIVIESLLLLGLLSYDRAGTKITSHTATHLQAKKNLVTALGLTDFAIWTEARYTRHPSQTDFFTAFQDFPGSLEHFPAGAIIAPPRSNTRQVK